MAKKPENGKQRHSTAAKFKTAEELQERLEWYFSQCDEEGKLYTEAGMAVFLGTAVSTLDDWWRGRRSEHLQETIRMAYTRIAEQIASGPRYSDRQMVSYRIFQLKQEKFGGYQDKIEAKSDLNVNVKMGKNMEESDFA